MSDAHLRQRADCDWVGACVPACRVALGCDDGAQGGSALEGETVSTKVDAGLRDRILRRLRHTPATKGVAHLDYVATNAIQDHVSCALSVDYAKEALVALWAREWLARLSWWQRLVFWWRLWRETR